MSERRPGWTRRAGEEWSGDFREDSALWLVRSERDIGVAEFRKGLENGIAYRRSPGLTG